MGLAEIESCVLKDVPVGALLRVLEESADSHPLYLVLNRRDLSCCIGDGIIQPCVVQLLYTCLFSFRLAPKPLS
jgi:hypothetical protein